MKVYQVDDYHRVVANSVGEAKEYYLNELAGEEDLFDGREVDIDKEKMWFQLDELPGELHKPPYKNWGYGECCKVPLRVAMKINKEQGIKPPYCIATSLL